MHPRDVLAAAVRCHQVPVWRYLRSLGCPADLADDMTQEAFLVAFDNGLRDATSRATARYLRSTARFLYLRTVRKDRRRAELLADAADFLWDRDCVEDAGASWLEALRDCVTRLDDRGRRVLQLFYGAGLGRAEVARELGMKENGVKTLLHRVRIALRECLQRKQQ